MTYAEKLTQWRRELQDLALVLMEDDDFETAQKVCAAAQIIKQVHDNFAEHGFDQEQWVSGQEAVASDEALHSDLQKALRGLSVAMGNPVMEFPEDGRVQTAIIDEAARRLKGLQA